MYFSLWVRAVVLVFLCVGFGNSQTPAPPEGKGTAFKVQISLKKVAVEVGAEAVVSVELINERDRVIRLPTFGHPYAVDVLDRSGKPAPLTPFGRQALRKGHRAKGEPMRVFVGRVIRIPAAGAATEDVAVTEYVSLTQPGEYVIRVSYSDPETNRIAISNTVTLTVRARLPK